MRSEEEIREALNFLLAAVNDAPKPMGKAMGYQIEALRYVLGEECKFTHFVRVTKAKLAAAGISLRRQ